jgi:hypothetical protein
MTSESSEPRDDELLREFRDLTISIQKNPGDARDLVLRWYQDSLGAKGATKTQFGMLLRNILDAIELDKHTVPALDAGSEKPLVLSLHGIRTRGDWQKQLSAALSKKGFVYEPLDYGFFRAIQLVLPFMRERKKKWFLEQYERATKGYLNPPSIIAHSFGTYLVAKTLQKYDELKFDRIIFCGSIVEVSYPWTTVLDSGRATRVLNDYGRKDRWAKTAEWFVNDSGPSGAKGFNDKANGRVLNRVRPEFRHSDFFYQTNYDRTWIPFLSGTDPSELSVAARRPPNWKFRIFVCLITLLMLFLGYLLWGFAFPKYHKPASGGWPTLSLISTPEGAPSLCLRSVQTQSLGAGPP